MLNDTAVEGRTDGVEEVDPEDELEELSESGSVSELDEWVSESVSGSEEVSKLDSELDSSRTQESWRVDA